tara:strand:+ start:228 stop:491 length:264 start_codon:yes stop_codon:yes gene_type:complete
VEPVGYRGFGKYSFSVVIHCLAFPASGRPGGALADYMALHSRIRHSIGSAVAFPKHLADSGNNQRYLVFAVEDNKGLVGFYLLVDTC